MFMTTAINPGVYMESRRKEILCLCYDRNMLQVRQMLLEHFGYVVHSTSSPEDAASRVRDRRPDMLLMDDNDSGNDFEQLAARVKQICPDVITVMLSPFYYVNGNSGSIDRVVSKDDGPDVLLSQIEELLGQEEKVRKRAARPM
jgi:CheY-like chemotaxis protein